MASEPPPILDDEKAAVARTRRVCPASACANPFPDTRWPGADVAVVVFVVEQPAWAGGPGGDGLGADFEASVDVHACGACARFGAGDQAGVDRAAPLASAAAGSQERLAGGRGSGQQGDQTEGTR